MREFDDSKIKALRLRASGVINIVEFKKLLPGCLILIPVHTLNFKLKK